MNREQLLTFLLLHSWTVAFCTCLIALRLRTKSSFILMAFGLTAVGIVMASGTVAYVGSDVLLSWLKSLSRGHLPVAAAAVSTALPWLLLLQTEGRQPQGIFMRLCPWIFAGSFTLTLASFMALMVVAPPVAEPELVAVDTLKVNHPKMEISMLAELGVPGIRIALGKDGRLFVAYTTFSGGNGQEWGGIVEIVQPDSGDQVVVKEVARSTLLWRSYGLATRNGDLFVSRSGRMAQAKNGLVTYSNAGAVTRLRDLDGDGYFEYYDDVVTGLPGSQGPIAQHQNNDLLFRDDGSLLITSGNVGNRQVPHHPWEGVLLETSPDFEQIEVIAEGLRNPFSLTLGPDSEIFLIDQDWAMEGDELNHIQKGAHYGHPFVVGMQKGEGYTPPILLGEMDANLVSIAYSESSGLPTELLGSFFVTDLFQDRILQIRLKRHENQFEVLESKVFAEMPGPLDLVIAEDGTMYVLSRNKKVYSITPKTSSKSSN